MTWRKSILGPKRLSLVHADSNPDHVSEFFRDARCPIRFERQTPNIGISNEHHQMGIGDWQVWSCLCSSGMTLSLDDLQDTGNYVVYAADSGAMEIDSGQKTHISPEESFFVGRSDHFDRVRIGAGRTHVAASFNQAAISRQLTAMIDDAVVQDVVFTSFLSSQSYKEKQLAQCIQFVAQHLKHDELVISPEFYRQLLNALTTLLLETVPNNYSERLAKVISPAVPRHMKKAIDYMHSHAHEPIAVVEIALAAGTSVRALQGAFRQFRDTTPLNYLRAIRLNGVRAKLTDPSDGSTVADAASSWGFTHLGRFSSMYHDAFGEMPLDTLKGKRRF